MKNLSFMFLPIFLLAGCSSNSSPETETADSQSWSAITKNDLDAAYTCFKENHPGYYDQENLTWKNLLEITHQQQSTSASQASSYEGYKTVMQSFIKTFDDPHCAITFVKKDDTQSNHNTAVRKAWIDELSPGYLWVRLPSFECNTPEEVAAMREVIAAIGQYKESDTIVFDVRGNGGGSSAWGLETLKALFSPEYVDYCVETEKQKNKSSVEWRASSDNIDYMKTWITPENIKLLNIADVVPLITATIEGCENALRKGEPFFKEREEVQTEAPSVVSNPVKAHIVLITDGGCASSCLDFIDTLFVIALVTHAGQTTNADTAYMECRSIMLPSGKASLTFPMKVYRNRTRKPYQKYYPLHLFTGDIHDTKAIQEWIRGVVK